MATPPLVRLADILQERQRRFRKTLDRARRDLREGDVHDLRVAARRLLAALDVLGRGRTDPERRKARRAVRRLLRRSGALRDAQVLLAATARLRGASNALGPYRRALRRRERDLARGLREGLRGLEAGKLERWVGRIRRRRLGRGRDPARDRRALDRARRRAEKALAGAARRRASLDAADPATAHRLRIAFRRLRYTIEALRPLLPAATPRRLNALRRIQGRLGDAHDRGLLAVALRAFAARRRRLSSRQALLRIAAGLERRRRAEASSLPRAADAALRIARAATTA